MNKKELLSEIFNELGAIFGLLCVLIMILTAPIFDLIFFAIKTAIVAHFAQPLLQSVGL